MTIARMLMLTVVFASACTSAPERQAAGGKPATEAVVGKIEAIEGDAGVLHGGQQTPATVGAELKAGDRLKTGAGGKIKASLTDGSVVAIGPGTDIELSDLVMEGGSRTAHLEVTIGKFWMNVTKWTGTGESSYEVATPNAVAGVRGTTLWGDTDVDAICALEGTIEVRSRVAQGLEPAKLSTGNCASDLSKGKLAPLAPTAEQLDRFLEEVLIGRKP